MNTKKCCCGLAVIVLSLAGFGVAGAGTTFHGVLNPNTHVVWIDTVIVTAPPHPETLLTPGWGSTSAAFDTFDFPDLVNWPLLIELWGSVDSVRTHQTFGAPQNGVFYPFQGFQPAPKVQFFGEVGIEESGNVIASPPRMSVSPSLVTAQMTVLLQPAGAGRHVVEVRDAAGNLVRSLDCTAGANGLATATWNREDGLGRLVPCGIYFCRYAASGAVAVRKVLVAR
jgi:hypothetical protein